MPLRRSISAVLRSIFGMQPASLAKASIADVRHPSWMRWSGRQIEANDQKHLLRNPRSKTKGRSATSGGSFFTKSSRTRIGNSKEFGSASAFASAEARLAATKNHRGVQTQIAFGWNSSRRFDRQ